MGMNGITEAQSTLSTQRTRNEESVEILSKEIDKLGAQTPAKSTEKAEMTATATTSAEIKAQIEALEKERARNIEKMEKIEKQIEHLADEAKEEIKQAAAKAEALTEENKTKADAALATSLEEYIAANKKEPGSMSKGDLSALIQKRLPDDSELAKCLAKFAEANEKIDEIDALLGSLNLLITDTNLIDKDISCKQVAYDQCKAAEEASKPKRCDPIGFIAKDAQGIEARYDFIIDDGNFDSTSDFLGAENQWAEMEDLDGAADGSKDGSISVDEMEKKNIKMVKTIVNPDGTKTQTVIDPRKEFGDDFSVDLNSYKQGGTHDAVSTADSDGDGVLDQQLLGTFNVNLGNGSEITGYNTLDDVDYLASEYGVVDNSAAAAATNLGGEELSQDLQIHENFFTDYTQKSEELKEQLAQGLHTAGVSEQTTELLRQSTLNVGKTEANIFMQKLEAEIEAEEEAEEAQEAKAEEAQEAKLEEDQAAEEAQEVDSEEVEDEDKKKLEDEE